MSTSNKVKLYLVPEPGTDIPMKKLDGMLFIKTPLKVFVDSRPAMLKFKQEVEFKDPMNLKGKAKSVVLEGFFKRTGPDEYRQMTAVEIKKVLGWMVRSDVRPENLTLLQMDTALASVLELDGLDEKIIIPSEGEERTKGGIILSV